MGKSLLSNTPLFFSVREAADRLGVSYACIHHWVACNRIPHLQQGKSARILIPRDYIEGLIDEAYKAVTGNE